MTIAGTAEAGSLIKVTDGSYSGVEQLSSSSNSFSIFVPLNSNSNNYISVTATDAAGNQSKKEQALQKLTTTGPAANVSVIEDNIAPAAPTISSPQNNTDTNANHVFIAGTTEAGSHITVMCDNSIAAEEQLGSGQTAFSVLVPLNANTNNQFYVTATDIAGNQGEKEQAF